MNRCKEVALDKRKEKQEKLPMKTLVFDSREKIDLLGEKHILISK